MSFNLPNSTRVLSAFLLLPIFLLLSYCPLRRAVQNLIKKTQETERSGTEGRAALTICPGVINRPDMKVNLPEHKAVASFPALTTIASFSILYLERNTIFQGKISLFYFHSIPIYIMNRVLLI